MENLLDQTPIFSSFAVGMWGGVRGVGGWYVGWRGGGMGGSLIEEGGGGGATRAGRRMMNTSEDDEY